MYNKFFFHSILLHTLVAINVLVWPQDYITFVFFAAMLYHLYCSSFVSLMHAQSNDCKRNLTSGNLQTHCVF